MLNFKPVIALVPARGNSKGVPRKNLRKILGRSLVEITLQAALDCGRIDSVYLSSDDEEILDEGRKLLIETIKRPLEFSTDTASANDVVKHFISEIGESIEAVDPYIIYLQPTSPLRTSVHIDSALSEMERHYVDSLISVVELNKSPYKTFSIDSEGKLLSLFEESLSNSRRQDLPKTYMPNGALYIFPVSIFLEHGGFPSNGSLPYIMSEKDSIDIDTEDDFKQLEQILGAK